MGTYKNPRKAGNPYSSQRDSLGRFKPGMRSLTLKDKISRRYPRKVICGLTSTEHQRFQALALKLGVSMSDIMAYLITNHLEQLALQASYEQGRIDAADNPQDSAENIPS
tara:strand:- start:19 stop:348 length:330 start_codon:yes stop_codon:yes gene_type:complete